MMARYIHWKVAKVVLNILFCFMLAGAYAQSPTLKPKVNYQCRAERLESVINHLSKTTGYDFIYSRDLVDISKTISLSVKDKSINEVLGLIEKQTNVSFRITDRHIIVKSLPKPAAAAKVIAKAPDIKSFDELLLSSTAKNIPVQPQVERTTLLQSHLEKKIRTAQDLLGSNVPRNIPNNYVNQINLNNRHQSWFAGIGTFVGDHGNGIEIQGGLPYAYAVFQPRWKPGGGFEGYYGIGSTFNLTGNFSFNAIYMYSSQKQSEAMGPFMRIETTHQHQIKLAVRYSFTKNLSVRVGPVLNYLTTEKEFMANYVTPPETSPNVGSGSDGNTYIFHNRRFETRSSRFTESWIGWEGSIQYRINFFENK